MSSLVLSDLHGHDSWPFSRPTESGLSTRFHDLLDVLQQVEALLECHQPDDLLILGDLLHRRHFVRFSLLNALLRAVQRLTERVKSTVILVGNHDYENAQVHGLVPFSYLPNVTVVDQPRIVKLSTGEDIMAIPYLHDGERVAQAFEQAPAVPTFAHYAAEGAPLDSEYWLDSPVKLGELMRFPSVVFGHIHPPSEQLDGRVIYVGAPMHFSFGDKGPRRCLRLIDGYVESHALEAPIFVTTKWPRIPAPSTRGYLRILDVPGPKVVEAREAALAVGWLDAVAVEGALPPEVREAVTSGLLVDRPLLEAYVARRCSDLPGDDQADIVEEGLGLLKEARG